MFKRTALTGLLVAVVSLGLSEVAYAPVINGTPAADELQGTLQDDQMLSYVPKNGVCEEEELCLFSRDNFRGDVYDFAPCENVPSFFGIRFINSARSLNNNAESVWNRSGYIYEIYDLSNYRGQSMEILGGRINEDDLGALADDISSHQCTGN
ncbi:peptidase inhibitor family I36 protein [Modestobacter marinus]|uniref:peptidase inhibitor family I36 protein n=1 Tax=Modestobacter marinus TaxID=477641 RepID=UPI001C98012F|nr:peptidase inhibitor family I36 protein [Modestobacter marinus]